MRSKKPFKGVEPTGMSIDELLREADNKPTEELIEQFRARKAATTPAAQAALIKARRAAIGGAQ